MMTSANPLKRLRGEEDLSESFIPAAAQKRLREEEDLSESCIPEAAQHTPARGDDDVDSPDKKDDIAANNTVDCFETEEHEEDSCEDWNPSLSRYDANMEKSPACGAYHPSFQKARTELANLIAQFPYGEECPSDTKLKILRAECRRLLHMPKAKPFTIALLGEAGKGKSSLLNALLDTIGLAETGASGKSCTNVITEFARAFDWQEVPYAAEIKYLDSDKIQAFLLEQIQHLRLYKFQKDDGWEAELEREHEKLHDTAMKVFCSMFCDHTEFSTRQLAEQYFVTTKRWHEDRVLAELSSWCMALIDRSQVTENVHRLVAHSSGELRIKMARYIGSRVTTDGSACVPTPWPLVEIVRVGVQMSPLLVHLVIADVPGNTDTNQVRKRATDRYLRRCNAAWIVANIDRVVDNPHVDYMLRSSFEILGTDNSEHVVLICTHSDANVDESLMTSVKGTQQMLSARKDQYTKIKKMDRELNQLDELLRRKQSSQHLLLMSQREDLVSQRHETDNEWFNALVGMRNRSVVAECQAEFDNIVPKAAKLQVFCVSNSHYALWKYPQKFNQRELDVNLTGIPKLRSFALQLVVPSIEDAFEAHLHDFEDFLIMNDMYCNKTQVQNLDELLALAAQPQQHIAGIIEKMFTSRTTEFEDTVLDLIKNNLGDYRNHAVKEHKRLAMLPAGTYRAFVKHFGHYKTKRLQGKKGQSISWNEKWLEPVKKKLRENWSAYEQTVKANLDECLLTEIGEVLIDELQSTLQGTPQVKMWPEMTTFLKYIASRKDTLKRIQVEANLKQKRLIASIWQRATAECADSFWLDTMYPAYKACAAESGKGVYAKIKGIMETHLQLENGRSPFAVMAEKMKQALEEDTIVEKEVLLQDVTKVFKDIVQTFELMLDTEEKQPTNSAVATEVEEQLQKYVVQSQAKLALIQTELQKVNGTKFKSEKH